MDRLQYNKHKSIDFNKIISGNKPFQDQDFPPSLASLISKDSKLDENTSKKLQQFVWKRPNDLFNIQEYSVFDNGIDSCDIIQGDLGNCYFLSTLSAIAEFPNRIKKIFIIDQVNQAGCYPMKLYINGEYKTVVVDDQFPYDKIGNHTAFSQARGKELWVILLEKAWAKLNGSYENTIVGFQSEAFRLLTGAPVIYFDHEEVEDFWQEIKEADETNFIICASVGKPIESCEDFKNSGLVSDHAYAVLEAHEVIHPNEGKVKLLKLRNPWGHQEWLGDWSDRSSKWTEELKQQLNVQQKNDGIFYMCYNDYLNFYKRTIICKFRDNFIYNFIRIQKDKHRYQLVKITLQEKQKVYFTVTQVNPRFVPKTYNYQVSFTKIMIGKIQDKNKEEPIKFIKGKCGRVQDLTVENSQQQEVGEYIAFIEIDWTQDRIQEFVFNTYSENDKITLKQQKYSDMPTILEDLLKSCGRQQEDKKTFADKGAPQISRVFSITSSNAEYGFIYYQNDSDNIALTETCVFNQLENFEILPYGNPNLKEASVYVEPKSSEIIVLRRTDRVAKYSVSYFNSVLHPESYYLEKIKEEGKMKQLQYEGGYKEIYFYTLTTDRGYYWLIENQTQITDFQAEFKLELKNLCIDEEDEKKNFIKVTLKPGEKYIKKIGIIDKTKEWGYKFSYTYKCVDKIDTELELIKEVKALGKKKFIQYKDTNCKVWYFVHFINGFYVFVFENFEQDKVFKAKFIFQLQNLKILDNDKNNLIMKVKIQPNQSIVKKLQRLNALEDSKYQCSYKYSFENCDTKTNKDIDEKV